MSKKILIGSAYFFGEYPDFKSKDRDYLTFVDKGNGFNYVRQFHFSDKCVSQFVKHPKDTLINYSLEKDCPMSVGKFLVPEVAQAIDLTINDLQKLQPHIDKLDDEHKYEKIIYEAYLENGDFTLTDEQRSLAYDEYKKYRPTKTQHKIDVDDDDQSSDE